MEKEQQFEQRKIDCQMIGYSENKSTKETVSEKSGQKKKQQKQQQQKALTVDRIPEKSKPIKKTLLKRKKPLISDPLQTSPILKKMYLVGDSIVLNQDAIRDPQNCKESLLMCALYLSRITSINYNEQYITLNCKRNQQTFIQIEYMYERFLSFQNQQMMRIATSFKDMMQETKYVEDRIAQLKKQQGQMQFWEKIQKLKENNFKVYNNLLLKKFKDKKYIVLINTVGMKSFCLDKIIISNAMLQFAGLKLSDLLFQYTKYRHLQFQLMGSSAYKQIFVNGATSATQIMKINRLNNEPVVELDPQKQIVSDFKWQLTGELYRKRHKNEVQWEEKLRCPLTFYKPMSHVSILQFGDTGQDKPVVMLNRQTKELSQIQFQPNSTFESELKKIETFKQKL